jgi:hypothetical protein
MSHGRKVRGERIGKTHIDAEVWFIDDSNKKSLNAFRGWRRRRRRRREKRRRKMRKKINTIIESKSTPKPKRINI